MRFCTVCVREVSRQDLRFSTFIFIEGFGKLTTIEGLLWQAGLRDASSKPPEKKNICPTAHYLLGRGAIFLGQAVT